MGLGVGAVVGLIGGPAERALACSCAETTLAEFVGRHPEAIVAAFTGTQTDRAVEDEQAEDGAVLTFAVDAVFIGDVGATHEVRTHAQSSACGLDVGSGAFARVTVVDLGDGPIAGLCSSLWSVEELAAQFGPGREPVGVPPPPDTGPDDRADDDGPRLTTRLGLGVVLLAVLTSALVVVRRRRDDERAGPGDG